MLKLILLVSFRNTGDLEQKEAIFEKIKTRFSSIYEIDLSKSKAIEKYTNVFLLNHGPTVTIAIGTHGVQFYSKFANAINSKQNYIVLSTHQYSLEVEKLVNDRIIDHLIIPDSSLRPLDKEKLANINITYLKTVPFKVINLEESFKSWEESSKVNATEKYIVVTLPGDAPIATTQKADDFLAKDNFQLTRRFSEESALELFQDLIYLKKQLGNEYKILLQNSPRTGKYSIDGEVICPHLWHGDTNNHESVDQLTRKFTSWLIDINLEYQFFPFTFKDGKISSSYNPLLYIASLENNYFITPGESISMLSQVPSYIPPSRNIVFCPDSMNEQHEKVFEFLVSQGHFSFFHNDNTPSILRPFTETNLYNPSQDLSKLSTDLDYGLESKLCYHV